MSIEGFDKVAAEQFQETTKDATSWPLTSVQTREFESILRAEAEAIRRLGEAQLALNDMQRRVDAIGATAEKARTERDAFCRKLEQELAIPDGTQWKVDLNNQRIEKR